MTQKKLPSINSAHGSDTRNIINELIKLFNGMGYTYNEALKRAHDILNEAKQTNFMNQDVQSQINDLILSDGESDAEVIQARGDFTVLRGRFEHNEGKTPLYVVDYGVNHTKTAEENTPLFQQAIEDAEVESRPVILPWTPPNKYIDINDAITVSSGGINIQGFGDQTKIRQNSFPNPVFDVITPNVTIDGFLAKGVDFNASGYNTAFRGSQTLHGYYAAVWVSADNVTIKNVKGDGVSTVVNVIAYDVINDLRRDPLKNVSVENIESNNVVFGMVVGGVDGFYFNNIKGNYNFMTGVGTPPHLLYFTQTNGVNKNVTGGNVYAFNSHDASPFQFKGVETGEISTLFADDCNASLNIMECKDLTLSNVSSVNDVVSFGEVASVNLQTENSHVIIENLKINMSSNGKAVIFGSETSNCQLRHATIKTNHTTTEASTHYDVDVRGTENVLDHVDVENMGSGQVASSIGVWGGDHHKIISPKTKGNTRGVIIRSGDGNIIENYELDDIGFKDTENGAKAIEISTLVKNFKLFPLSRFSFGIGDTNDLIAVERCNVYSNTALSALKLTSGHSWIWSFGGFAYDGNGGMFVSSGAGALTGLDLERSNIDLRTGLKYGDREEIVVRAVDRRTHLAFRINHHTNTAELIKRVDGESDSTLTSTPYTTRQGKLYKLRVTAFDDIIECYVDNAKILEHVLSTPDMTTFEGNTFHGLKGNQGDGGVFSNIEYREIE